MSLVSLSWWKQPFQPPSLALSRPSPEEPETAHPEVAVLQGTAGPFEHTAHCLSLSRPSTRGKSQGGLEGNSNVESVTREGL